MSVATCSSWQAQAKAWCVKAKYQMRRETARPRHQTRKAAVSICGVSAAGGEAACTRVGGGDGGAVRRLALGVKTRKV